LSKSEQETVAAVLKVQDFSISGAAPVTQIVFLYKSIPWTLNSKKFNSNRVYLCVKTWKGNFGLWDSILTEN
jgi:hypothetical protein